MCKIIVVILVDTHLWLYYLYFSEYLQEVIGTDVVMSLSLAVALSAVCTCLIKKFSY